MKNWTRKPVVIGLGELLWDVFPDGKRPGGAPANFAYQAGQLGCSGVLLTRVGSDAAGDEILAALSEKDLDLTKVQRDAQAPTGWVSVTLKEGHPEYIIHEDVAWDSLDFTSEWQTTMQTADAVCFGTLAQRNAVSREAILSAVKATRPDCLRIYDVNLRQHYYSAEWIESSLQLATIVKLNEDEQPVLAELLDLPADPVEFAQALIKRFPVKNVCITRGARGCVCVTNDEVHDVAGLAVKVADTVGAGDAFTAGYAFSRLHDWPMGISVEFANRVGAMVASRQGAMPELRQEFAQLIQRYS